MLCLVCKKSYTNIGNLKVHYSSAIHKKNLSLTQSVSLKHSLDRQHNIDNNNKPSDKLSEESDNEAFAKSNQLLLNRIIDGLPDINDSQLESQEIIKYECPCCESKFTQKTNLYRHQKKCSFYQEAFKLSSKTQIDVKIASKLLKQKHLSKAIPQLRLDDALYNNTHSGKITNNNTNNNNITNNITNNINITVGNWETLNFIRPFLHENISHLYTDKNRLEIIKNGNNAVNVAINLIYEMPENKNIYRYNERRNFVKTPNIDGQVVSYPANEAFSKLACAILDITDDIMTNSEDILTQYPQYRRGVEAYGITNNWHGEGGNERFKEYEKNIEMNIESSHKTSEINITRFENEKRKILMNGGTLDFNKRTINNMGIRPEIQIQQTISAIKQKMSELMV